MILIVDDIDANLIALQKTLEVHRLKVETANSGEEALKKILKFDYSLIILDVQMPGMDGFEVAEILAQSNRTKDIPVLFLSAISKEKKYISRGYASGAVDYITKPVDPDLLILKVKSFLKISEQQQELKRIQEMLFKEVEIRKAAQEKLSEEMHQLQFVLESVPQMAFVLSKDGALEYVNKQWSDYSNDVNQFPTKHPDDSEIWNKWKQHLMQGKEFQSEIRLQHLSSSEYRYFMMKIVPIQPSGSITKWVGTFTDIHQQKITNESLEKMVLKRTKELTIKNEDLEFSNHELQQFAWVVSHDLKEPIRKIEMIVKMIKDRFIEKDSPAVDYIDRAVNSARRMRLLIDDLLVYARLSAQVDCEPTDLNVVIKEVLDDLDAEMHPKQPTITVAILPEIMGIPSQLRQVFQNLIGNALKFTKPGVPPIISVTWQQIADRSIDSPEDPNGKFCKIIVTDNGIGFDESMLHKIFIIFQSLNNRQVYEGTGIGLAIAKKIIEKHNGIITAKSKIDEGSSFIVILPLKK
ncbi:response regulator [Flavobacterium antarcticum]|uniref:hybrid sensor histidine kinase/response regulator n=1 Tax=Flavobacterium antarcticum TaxID=271155 RepID=UPI0003B5B64A|nr:response regulator [Flavobacterium antarcticum]